MTVQAKTAETGLTAEDIEKLSSDSEGGPAQRLGGWMGWLTGIVAFGLSAYALYWTQFSVNTTVYRSSFLAIALALAFWLYPLVRNNSGGPRRATLEEWLMAAEYVLAGGNFNVALCERGVRTFADHSRNTLDLSIVPPVKKLSHLPILVDPSHGTGKAEYVSSMALAGLASGADGLLIEVHPEPSKALSDAAQTIDYATFDKLLANLKRLAEPLGRTLA